MNRRSFIAQMIAAGLVATIDPERLLWEPGRKLISIPKPPPLVFHVSYALKLEDQGWQHIEHHIMLGPDGKPWTSDTIKKARLSFSVDGITVVDDGNRTISLVAGDKLAFSAADVSTYNGTF